MRRRIVMSRIAQPSFEPRIAISAPGNHFIAHGSLHVERSLDRDFRKAEAYLRADGIMSRTFDDLENAAQPTYVVGNHRNDDHFDFASHAVTWDPHSALVTFNGGSQSPALGLGHELSHADENAVVRARLAATFDPAYDTKKERRVIRGAEAHAARTLHEGVRHDHGGSIAYVAGPTDLA